MDPELEIALLRWLSSAALAGSGEADQLAGACRRLRNGGVPVDRGFAGVELIHPLLDGQLFRWDSARDEVTSFDLDRFDDDEAQWRASPLFRLYDSGDTELRRRIAVDYEPGEFPLVDDLRAEGFTDYVAFMCQRGGDHQLGERDATFLTFATRAPHGFEAPALETLRHLAPCLATTLMAATGPRMTYAMMQTYLGRDAGRQVLRGNIARGEAEEIQAVLWLSDLHGFTRIADETPSDQLVPMLNDYADCQARAVEAHGGDVLKFMGDGVLAIFPYEHQSQACAPALDAAADAHRAVARLNQRRSAQGLPTTTLYLGLHVGSVFYGNVGSAERLDFTVVGPAVNEVSRLAGMCKAVQKDVVVSSAFAEATPPGCRPRLVALGRYALRGVRQPQELFTMDPSNFEDGAG
jgi:adenylate cyclase